MPLYRKLGNGCFVDAVRLLFGGSSTDLCYGYSLAPGKHGEPRAESDGRHDDRLEPDVLHLNVSDIEDAWGTYSLLCGSSTAIGPAMRFTRVEQCGRPPRFAR
jgi:hypothetical protein